jgi:shikimate kinase / 3-dehydroquinate synthase
LTKPTEITVELGDRSYPIWIGQGLLGQLGSLFRSVLPNAKRVVLLSNVTVQPLYGTVAKAELVAQGIDVLEITIPDGESYKTLSTMEGIITQMLTAKCDRKTVLIALGGGVVGDIGGFVAASYQRGIPFVQVPTTLLAQVDSSVGGKVAVNHALGKNMIGAFYQPKAVIIDTDTLSTLPKREFSAGLAEVIKYGFINDASFVAWCEHNVVALNARNRDAVRHAIMISCQAKAQIVKEDETEKGVRALLNLGHTFGHAVESGLGYGVWLHGEAVGAGIVAAARLSERKGWLSQADRERVTALVAACGCPTTLPTLGAQRYWELMQNDKKNTDGKMTFILLQSIGEGVITEGVASSELAGIIT